MPKPQRTVEIALVCDTTGHLETVLHDTLGLTRHLRPHDFHTLVDPASQQKAEYFLAALRERGSVFDWELNVVVGEEVVALRFAGGFTGSGYCIIGTHANSALGLMETLDELMQVNNEQLNALRALLQQQSQSSRSAREHATSDYEQITRLNNQLVQMQRELAQRNAGLARTLAELEQTRARLEAQHLEIQHMNAELARSNNELQQFAFVVSHDLQAPLRSVQRFVQLFQEHYQGALDEKAERWIGHIVGGATRMHNLIDAILAYSRIETRAQAFAPVSLNQVVERQRSIFADLLSASGGQITHGDLPTVHGDVAQLNQLLQNLISNGLTYSGTEPPAIHITAELRDSMWQIAVRDNGIGIAASDHEAVFEMLRRLHTQEEYPGSGMGLAICRQVVRRHGGTIWFESELGAGSTFFFSLPNTQV